MDLENTFGKCSCSSHVQVKSHLEIDVEINEDLILPADSVTTGADRMMPQTACLEYFGRLL